MTNHFIEDCVTKKELVDLLANFSDDSKVFVVVQMNDEVGYFPVIDVTSEVHETAPTDIKNFESADIAIFMTDEEIR
jgi:hypothetical protein